MSSYGKDIPINFQQETYVLLEVSLPKYLPLNLFYIIILLLLRLHLDIFLNPKFTFGLLSHHLPAKLLPLHDTGT